MKTATINFWVRTPSDNRDTASSMGSIRINQRKAYTLAKEIDRCGNRAIEDFNGIVVWEVSLPEGHRIATGHGVSIVYESGYRKVAHYYK